MSIMMYMLRNAMRQSPFAPKTINEMSLRASSSTENKIDRRPLSPRMSEFKMKLAENSGNLKVKQVEGEADQFQKETFKPWPNNTNPNTGEIGGPSGPEPTRYGDWERKGRVSDF